VSSRPFTNQTAITRSGAISSYPSYHIYYHHSHNYYQTKIKFVRGLYHQNMKASALDGGVWTPSSPICYVSAKETRFRVDGGVWTLSNSSCYATEWMEVCGHFQILTATFRRKRQGTEWMEVCGNFQTLAATFRRKRQGTEWMEVCGHFQTLAATLPSGWRCVDTFKL
jgi:hypothetical protein